MTISSPKVAKARPMADDDEIDLLALLSVLLRGWKIILAFALAGLLLGVLYSRYVNPTYKADALLQLDEKSLGLSALGANISDLVAPEVSLAQTERELIKSRMVLQPVVDQLHLDIQLSDPQQSVFDRLAQARTATAIHYRDRVVLDTEQGQAKVSSFIVPPSYLNHNFILTATKGGFDLSDGSYHYPGHLGMANTFKTSAGDIEITVLALPAIGHPVQIVKQSLQSSTDALNSALSVSERGKQTGILELSLTGSDQQEVSRILTQVVASYVNQNQDRSSEQTTTTIEFMASQIPKLQQKLEAAEAAFNEFRETYGTIDVSKEAELLLTESSQIERQLNQLTLKMAELSTYYTDEHPLVIQISDQLKVLLSRKQQIQQTIEQLPEIQREFLQLSEDMGINREIYLTMLKNHEQLKIVKAGEIGYVRVVDMPISTFNPIAPKKGQIWILALLLGTMLGTLLVLLKNLLRNTVKDPERLEAKTGIPVIATIPRCKSIMRLSGPKRLAGRLLAQVDHNGLSYEAIKSLRTFLLFGMPSGARAAVADEGQNQASKQARPQGKVILITSESPGAGKSFITANLAEVFSQLHKKILVIDADMRLGHLHQIFTPPKAQPINGLAEYLATPTPTSISESDTDLLSEAVAANCIHATAIEGIDFLPRGRAPHNPAALLAGERFAELMAQLTEQYDYIFLDTPPLLGASDAIIAAQFADKVLMVTRYNHSIEGQLAYVIKQLQSANINIDGIVLNDIRQGVMEGYGNHYGYNYGHIQEGVR